MSDTATQEMPTIVKRQDLLSHVTDCIQAQQVFLLSMRSQWLIVDMFCRGVQNIQDYDPNTGTLYLNQSYDQPQFAGYNRFRSTLNRTKSMLMQSPPRREAKPTRDDIFAVDRARLSSVVMDDAFHRFNIKQKSQLVADGFLKSGVFVYSFFLDPSKGEVIGTGPDGQPLRTGQLTPQFDIAERWIWDPRATTPDQVKYACRVIVVATEEAKKLYPKASALFDSLESSISDTDILENRMLNSTQRQNYGQQSMPVKGKGRVVLFYYFEEPCPDYPSGGHAILVGSSMTPIAVVEDYGFNTYGCIPAGLWVQDVSAYCLLGNGSFFNDMIAGQRELNKRANAELANCDLLANPRMLVPRGSGVPINDFTNDYGEVIEYDASYGAAPAYMVPAEMPQMHFEAKNFAIQQMDQQAPSSSSDIEQAEKTSSGIHAAQVAEVRRQSVIPMITNWEDGWDAFWKMYVKLWKRLTLYPQQIRQIGPRGQILYREVSGFDLGDDVEVSIVPYSSMPVSRTAAFAEWTELLKLGYGRIDTPLRPEIERKMLEDIGKGDMTTSWRDFGLDSENADFILTQVWMGEQVVPRVQDNPDLVIEKLVDEMKTSHYRMAVEQNPMIEANFSTALAMFGLYKQARDQQTAMARASAMAMSQTMASAQGMGGPPQQGQGGGKNPVQAAAKTHEPGKPQGGAMANQSQGFGKAPNQYVHAGGRPTTG